MERMVKEARAAKEVRAAKEARAAKVTRVAKAATGTNACEFGGATGVQVRGAQRRRSAMEDERAAVGTGGAGHIYRTIGRVVDNPAPTEVDNDVPVVADAALTEAAEINSRLERTRIEQSRWAFLPSFVNILLGERSENIGAEVASVHGDPNYGSSGPQRHTNEVMAYDNEILCYVMQLHPLIHLLYAWAMMFQVQSCETFEVAANNFGRLRRSWMEAVFLERSLATRLAVPFAFEPGMGEYLEELVGYATTPRWELDTTRGPEPPLLEFPFRTQSQVAVHHWGQENRYLLSRAYVPSV